MDNEIVLILGYPACGKTTLTKERFSAHDRLNRDDLGGSLSGLAGILQTRIKSGIKSFVLDNTFVDKASRSQFVAVAKKNNLPIRCVWLTTSLEDAQFNACQRMIRKYGRLLDSAESKRTKDDNCFPNVVLYAYRKSFEEPTIEEGFDSVERVTFKRTFSDEYQNKALILDYDGTLRKTKSGGKYPLTPKDIEILPKRKEILERYKDKGFILAGISNQSGIAGEKLSANQAISCFKKTNELLEQEIDFNFCPHRAFPLDCFCRKPHVGLGVKLIEKHKLNPKECIMVGDLKTDKTLAERCGFQYVDADKFFR